MEASKNPHQPSPWEYAVAFLVMALMVAFAFFTATSCSTPREVIRYQRDTLYKVKTDSIHHYERDSVFVKEKGDTIYIYKEKVRYRDRWKIDTIVRVKVDSVAVERIKEVPVERPLTWWQKTKIRAFWGLLVAVLLLALWTFRKPLLKRLKI